MTMILSFVWLRLKIPSSNFFNIIGTKLLFNTFLASSTIKSFEYFLMPSAKKFEEVLIRFCYVDRIIHLLQRITLMHGFSRRSLTTVHARTQQYSRMRIAIKKPQPNPSTPSSSIRRVLCMVEPFQFYWGKYQRSYTLSKMNRSGWCSTIWKNMLRTLFWFDSFWPWAVNPKLEVWSRSYSDLIKFDIQCVVVQLKVCIIRLIITSLKNLVQSLLEDILLTIFQTYLFWSLFSFMPFILF